MAANFLIPALLAGKRYQTICLFKDLTLDVYCLSGRRKSTGRVESVVRRNSTFIVLHDAFQIRIIFTCLMMYPALRGAQIRAQIMEKTFGIGLHVNKGQSIEVDSVNPQLIFLIADNSWNRYIDGFEGLYRSFEREGAMSLS